MASGELPEWGWNHARTRKLERAIDRESSVKRGPGFFDGGGGDSGGDGGGHGLEEWCEPASKNWGGWWNHTRTRKLERAIDRESSAKRGPGFVDGGDGDGDGDGGSDGLVEWREPLSKNVLFYRFLAFQCLFGEEVSILPRLSQPYY